MGLGLAAVPLEDYKSVPRKQRKKCIRCKKWYTIVGENKGFGKGTCADGFQSICRNCKNIAIKKRRDVVPAQRIRHHFRTRIEIQLEGLAPADIGKKMEKYLGYSIRALTSYLSKELKEREGPKRKLREALAEGYHVDHIHALKNYQVVRPDRTIDWDEFRRCWAMENLKAIPAVVNLKKGDRPLEDQDTAPRNQSLNVAEEVA